MKNSQLSNAIEGWLFFFLLKSLYYQRLFVSLQHENPPSLSTMLKCAGRFCFYRYMATKIPFIKTYSTPQELVQLLKTRGMEITDEEKAQHYLSHIGYYRLSAYMYPLFSIPKEQHLFKRGVSFGNLVFLLVGKTNHCGNKRYMTIRFIRITKASHFSKIEFCRIQLLST